MLVCKGAIGAWLGLTVYTMINGTYMYIGPACHNLDSNC